MRNVTTHLGLDSAVPMLGPDNTFLMRSILPEAAANNPSSRNFREWPWHKGCQGQRCQSSEVRHQTTSCHVGQRAATTRLSINAQCKLQGQIGGHVIIIQDATTAYLSQLHSWLSHLSDTNHMIDDECSTNVVSSLQFGADTQDVRTRFGTPPIHITYLSAGCSRFPTLTTYLKPLRAFRFGFRRLFHTSWGVFSPIDFISFSRNDLRKVVEKQRLVSISTFK